MYVTDMKNRSGIKVTFNVPENEVKEIKEIIEFCKEKDMPYSPILVKLLKHWYKRNKKVVNNLIYKESDIISMNPS